MQKVKMFFNIPENGFFIFHFISNSFYYFLYRTNTRNILA